MIVCDPPKLCPSRKHVHVAASQYKSINEKALRVLRPGGILFTFTCSQAFISSYNKLGADPTPTRGSVEKGILAASLQDGPDRFIDMIRGAAISAGRTIRIVEVVGPSRDHPFVPGYLDGRYLMGVVVYCVA